PLAAPLPTEPRALWTAAIPSLGIGGDVAVTPDRVAAIAGSTLSLLDHRGGLVARWWSPTPERLSAPMATADGSFIVASDSVFCVDASGHERWRRSLGRSALAFGEPPDAPLLAPDGDLIAL